MADGIDENIKRGTVLDTVLLDNNVRFELMSCQSWVLNVLQIQRPIGRKLASSSPGSPNPKPLRAQMVATPRPANGSPRIQPPEPS